MRTQPLALTFLLSLPAVSGGGAASPIAKNIIERTVAMWDHGQEVEVALDRVQPGDVLRVKPGDKIPVDGVISQGTSTIDESMITGEPIPVQKGKGEKVSSGTGGRRAVILATNVYLFTDAGWRMLAHHASLPLVESNESSEDAPRPLH